MTALGVLGWVVAILAVTKAITCRFEVQSKARQIEAHGAVIAAQRDKVTALKRDLVQRDIAIDQIVATIERDVVARQTWGRTSGQRLH